MNHHSLKSLLIAAGLSVAVTSPILASEAEDLFKRMDTNGDGRITSAEHAQSAETMFKQSDADRDGKVSAAECESAQMKHGDKVDKQAAATHLRQVDTDGDGQINSRENSTFARNAFARADKNSDGILSEDEFEDAHQAMKKELKD
jgi:Ca2+-binding EF-hand superfamily protein